MSLHRFFVATSSFNSDGTFRLEGEVVHQLARVLRLAPGSQLVLLDGTGREFLAVLEQCQPNSHCSGRILEERVATTEPRTRLTLFQAMLKGEKFEYVLQKGTEVGVSRFVPVLTERVIGGQREAKLERWHKIVREAAEQSRRGIVPEVAEPISFEQALKQLVSYDLALMAWEDEPSLTLRAALQKSGQSTSVGLLIGPEGGFSAKEATLANQEQVQTVSLGPRILRAETAGPIATALILYTFDDL